MKCECGSCDACKARERYRSMTKEERRAWVARRDPERVKANDRTRYYRNYKKRRAAADAYRAEHRDEVQAAAKRWAQRNPEKRKAHNAVSNALRDGKLIKGGCSVPGCRTGKPVQAHHEDYSKPLEVVWLCTTHHGEKSRRAHNVC